MLQEEWDIIQADYVERMRIARIEGIQHEKDALDDIFKHLELQDLKDVVNKSILPVDVFVIADVDVEDDTVCLISRKWNEKLCIYDDIFKYKKEAIERDKYYQLTNNYGNENRYEMFLEYQTELQFMSGETITNTYEDIPLEPIDISIDKLKEAADKVVIVKDEPKKKKVLSENDENDEDEFEEDEDGNLTRTDEILNLDDEFDDTFGDMPEGYVVDEPIKVTADELANVNGMDKESDLQTKEEPEDEWGF
jgi:hypothetical protein